jgi:hypothetical protein
MTEQELARRFVQHLDEGLETLRPSTLHRLQRAREAALARVPASATHVRLASAGEVPHAGHGWSLNSRVAAAVIALTFALLGMLYWQQQVQHVRPPYDAEFADVDAEVLTDELPVVAYLDPGFEIWLYHHTPAARED